ncbi:putative protein FAM10A4 [Homalodisca vitripennis]|uniref:putative protein FAM10A4 n=1 Tax=Homalodisca vitripennis TaxID=197043 RepID=UPI001EEBF3A0|nr:putative protein FAM10A4 [Homalodisca vitripennis]
MAALPKEAIAQLKVFIHLVKTNPELLHTPDLKFFKDFLESYGGKVPEVSSQSQSQSQSSPSKKPTPAPEPKPPTPEPESEESDIELDNSGVIEPDTAEPLPEVDEAMEITEEQMDQSNEKKREAIKAYSDQEYEKAAEFYTEAIKLNPGSALLYAKRGQCYLNTNKPNACIRDCTRALVINPDCAPAYKFRGRAHRLLGNWEQAAQDLRNACKIDFDEQADEWLREVTPNARKLEEHKLKYERKRREKELQEKKERVRRAREANEAARQEAAQNMDEDMAGDFSGLGGGMGANLFNLLNDPELMQAFKDPEVAAAFQDISQNSSNYMKYLDNPKVVAVIEKMSGKYSGMAGGFPGGFPGGPPPPPSSDDTELD